MIAFASFNHTLNVFYTHVANATFLHVVHTIWMARNSVCFNNATVSVHAETTKVLTSISLSHKLIPGHASTAEHAAAASIAETNSSIYVGLTYIARGMRARI
jgi:hypothetical protein